MPTDTHDTLELLSLDKLTPALLQKVISRANFAEWMRSKAAGKDSDFTQGLKKLNEVFTHFEPGAIDSPPSTVMGLSMAQLDAQKSESKQDQAAGLAVLFVTFTYLGYKLAQEQLAETLRNSA